jgi:hypothetical protein
MSNGATSNIARTLLCVLALLSATVEAHAQSWRGLVKELGIEPQ